MHACHPRRKTPSSTTGLWSAGRGGDAQGLVFLAARAANNELYSRVIVLLCKCEKITPAGDPAAGEEVREPPGAPSGERKQSLGLREIRCSPGAEIGVSIFVLWVLTAAGRGRRSVGDKNTPLMGGRRPQIGRAPPPFQPCRFQEIKHQSCRNASLY